MKVCIVIDILYTIYDILYIILYVVNSNTTRICIYFCIMSIFFIIEDFLFIPYKYMKQVKMQKAGLLYF